MNCAESMKRITYDREALGDIGYSVVQDHKLLQDYLGLFKILASVGLDPEGAGVVGSIANTTITVFRAIVKCL